MSMFVSVSVISGIVAGSLALPVAGAVGGGINTGAALLNGLPSDLLDPVLDQTSVMTAADGSTIAYFYDENRVEEPLSKISPWLQRGIVAVEDSRFYSHGAVDARGLLRAIVNNETGGQTQGASTITQQYVKNAQVEQAMATGNKTAAQAAVADTVQRKLIDIRLAASLEKTLTKQQILDRYLNIVYFGDQTYGAQAAAERYFGVSAAKLTIAQAATLAGMVQNPTGYNPRLHRKAAQRRRDVVLGDLFAQKMITQDQYTKAVRTKVKVVGSALPNGCASAVRASDGFFCQYVVQSILNGKAYSSLGATSAARRKALYRGGLVIRTSLDPVTQRGAVQAVDRAIPRHDPSGLGTTAVTVEPGTGRVLAMAEDRTYSVRSGRGRTSVNYAVDHDLGGGSGFQTGSSFKPFTLANWLQTGHGLSDSVNATRRGFPFSEFTACGRALSATGTAPYSPGNSEGTESGSMSVARATADSVNVAYVEMESRLDLCDIADTAQSLGVHLAAARQECASATGSTTKLPTCLPSLTLGVENIAPLTMAAAYAGFAAGGTYCAPRPVLTVTRPGKDGGARVSAPVPGSSCRTALTPAVAAGVTTALKQVLTSGTAAAVGPLSPWPSAGKTGTTDGPYDTWFVGYTAQRSTAVWVGDPGSSSARRRLTDITVAGRRYGVVYGASIAAPIWKNVMNVAMRGLTAEPLP